MKSRPGGSERRLRSRPVALLPNLMTLANVACGLLAISWGIDALALSEEEPELFYAKMEAAAWLIFLGMVLDGLDGRVARMTGSVSDFGAQLDSFADFLTFGCAPALLAKVLIEHEAPLVGYLGHPRLHFVAAATFAIMGCLRLARFNVETEPHAAAHRSFKGLPSPAAAGSVCSYILIYLALRSPEIETSGGTRTLVGRGLSALRDWFPSLQTEPPAWPLPVLAVLLVALGGLMVSRLRYPHGLVLLLRPRSQFLTLVYVVFCAFVFFSAPIPILFAIFNGFVLFGLARALIRRRARGPKGQEAGG